MGHMLAGSLRSEAFWLSDTLPLGSHKWRFPPRVATKFDEIHHNEMAGAVCVLRLQQRTTRSPMASYSHRFSPYHRAPQPPRPVLSPSQRGQTWESGPVSHHGHSSLRLLIPYLPARGERPVPAAPGPRTQVSHHLRYTYYRPSHLSTSILPPLSCRISFSLPRTLSN
ncbi:hypothetical protein B0T16DRAFT_1088 [Cercophora newfieldiana]|uniref:Uncharacterized protein n=1 Tax=Cercophora newfieldiana TaxID=92897 RepID=A0AA40CX61_9PEZI|nr:hypothetical protein B0T16DRAFT_1088 [Cercophora newfieldiana]